MLCFDLKGVVAGVTGSCSLTPTPKVDGHRAERYRTCSLYPSNKKKNSRKRTMLEPKVSHGAGHNAFTLRDDNYQGIPSANYFKKLRSNICIIEMLQRVNFTVHPFSILRSSAQHAGGGLLQYVDLHSKRVSSNGRWSVACIEGMHRVCR
ncbi:jg232 [Pararge aegeria aegeria]|uniref:Jg232 protein n=1 Tax=Pararge aegeria aegeria TaxID=348720 RepID=A0A8S4QWQ7_9NEOP|nr:jg232 [Pararge aegeria aegeria]